MLGMKSEVVVRPGGVEVDWFHVDDADKACRVLKYRFESIQDRLDLYDHLLPQVRGIATKTKHRRTAKVLLEFLNRGFERLNEAFAPYDSYYIYECFPQWCRRGHFPKTYRIGDVSANSAHELACVLFFHVSDLWIEARQVAVYSIEDRMLQRCCQHFYQTWLSLPDIESRNLRLWLRAEYDRACLCMRPKHAIDLEAGSNLVLARHRALQRVRTRRTRGDHGNVTIATRSLRIDVTQRVGSDTKESTPSTELIECEAYRFERHGSVWHLRFNGEAVTVPHKVGMIYIQRLLQHPSVSVSVQELVAPDATGAALATTTDDPSLDRNAVGTLLSAARELRAGIDAAGRVNNTVEKDMLQRELSAIEHQLKQRNQPTRPELKKMQSSVGKAIRRAIENIARHHKPLHIHLRDHIQTGYMPCYTPPTPISWLT